jgi:hypothetical protein
LEIKKCCFVFSGCNYVLHSTGQLYSHKRKHERRDFEFAYKRFKQESGDDKGGSSNEASSVGGPSGAPSPSPQTQPRPIAPKLGLNDQLPHGLVLPQPLSLPLEQQQAIFSHAQKALMMAIGLQSHGGRPREQNDPEYMDLEDLKNFDTKTMNSGASSPNSGSISPPPATAPSNPHSKFSLTAEIRQQQIQSALARYASVLKHAELNNSLSLPIPNFLASERIGEAAAHTVTCGDVAMKEERESPVPVPVQLIQDQYVVPLTPPCGDAPLLQRPLPKIMEKRERDESWKKYMIRSVFCIA